MKYLVTGEQAAAIDADTIQKCGLPSLVLMERASLAVAEEVIRMSAGQKGKDCRIAAVCGSGNNGGDGMAAARILFTRGYPAEILLAADPDKLSGDAARQLEIARNFGVPVRRDRDLTGFDLILDALFGTGLSREITGTYAEWIDAVNAVGMAGSRICAVDIASGVHAGSGRILGKAVLAEVTVTFGYQKLGMVLYPGSLYCGRQVCAEIGFDPRAIRGKGPVFCVPEWNDLKKIPERKPDSHKGSFGKVLTIAGSRNMAGAAFLSGKAAYLTGTGLVTLLSPECNREILQTLLPEAVMKTYEEEALPADLEELLRACDVTVLGPGLGRSQTAKDLVKRTLQQSRGPVILDADALNILAEGHLDWLESVRGRCILTPHKMELSRLTGYNIQSLKEKQIEICEAFSREHGVILIAKDARTLVHDGTGDIFINTSGNDGMACGGSGDVLTGVIAGLLAQGMSLADAAKIGVYLHGLAGDEAAAMKGRYSMTASDILDEIPISLQSIYI